MKAIRMRYGDVRKKATDLLRSPILIREKRRQTIKRRLFNKADQAMVKQDWRSAITHWQTLIKKYGDITPGEAWLKLARAQRELGVYDLAQQTLSEALLIFSDDIRLDIELGELAVEQEDWHQAVVAYKMVVDTYQDRTPVHVWLKLSRAYMRLSMFKKAMHTLERASKLPRISGQSKAEIAKTIDRYEGMIQRTKADQAKFRKLLRKYYGYTGPVSNRLCVDVVLQRGTTRPTSSAFIRLISPLTQAPAKNTFSVEFFDGSNYLPSSQTNICIIQRTSISSLGQAQQIVKVLKRNGSKLVIDLDDSFNNLDPDHAEYTSQVKKVAALTYLLSQADQFWASTNDVLSSYAKGVTTFSHVIPNTLDQRIWKTNSPANQDTKPLQLLYMGTSTHAEDLAIIIPALASIAQNEPNSFTLHVMGIASDIPSYSWINNLSSDIPDTLYPEFVRWFIKQGPFAIGLAPLADTNFNRAKSDIKCLDYMAVGCVPVVSDVEPYRNPELDSFIVRVKNTKNDWQKMLLNFIHNPQQLGEHQQKVRIAGKDYLQNVRSDTMLSEKLTQFLLGQ